MEIFNNYKNDTDRFESLYTIVIYNNPVTDTLNRLQHHLALINLISDKFKRQYLYSRLDNFKEYIKNRYDGGNITNIFLIGREMSVIDIIDRWKVIIEEFDVDPFIFRNGEHYDIDFLQNLLTDNIYYNVIMVSPNKFVHSYYNQTKRKRIHQTNNFKISDLLAYLQELDSICIVHGTSNLLSNLISMDLPSHVVLNKLLRDEEIIEVYDRHNNTKNSMKLDQCLSKMLHPIFGKRLIFGKDIQAKIFDMQLETLFCSPSMAQKVAKRIPEELKKFELIIIRSYGDDIGKRLEKDYNGIVGISYY